MCPLTGITTLASIRLSSTSQTARIALFRMACLPLRGLESNKKSPRPQSKVRRSIVRSKTYGVFCSVCEVFTSPVIGFLVVVVSSCLWPPKRPGLSDSLCEVWQPVVYIPAHKAAARTRELMNFIGGSPSKTATLKNAGGTCRGPGSIFISSVSGK